MASIRLFEVAQYGLILLIGLLAFHSRRIASDGKWIFAAMIAGFWLIHAAAYIITRYRDPAIPLLIVLAAIPVARSEEHTSELQSRMRTSYAVFCWKKTDTN